MTDKPGYYVCHRKTVTGKYQFSATGPGIGDDTSKPWFETEANAETLCRCLAQALAAGERMRSEEILTLLEAGRCR